MKKSKTMIISLILVLLIVIFVSKALQDSYLKITNSKVTMGKNKSVSVVKNNEEKSHQKEENKTKISENTHVAEAKEKKVVFIDPGHANRSNLEKEPIAPNSSKMKIKDGGGAEGVVSKTPEYLVNMKVSLKLKAFLQEKGYIVKMTKEDNSLSLGNVERAEVANKENAALVIRIHADSNDNSSVKGSSMLVPASINENTKLIHDKSSNYGKIILDTLVNEVGMKNRGVVERDDMTGFNWSKVPVVLIEMGFLSNEEEDKLLNTDDYQNKVAKALADGIDLALK
ncbi:N-acetylmuramoyl-L-alanine amidase [Clostridium thailandense]|uniref:N-acetylmuramoyl-L-alanine amidase n=1 Tax=Clostridium thailandense TaxID=2794346 RepID=A0A949U0E7_9CLOT|nr:N-acetylmuramoyl-L-alanine amidase [Clostridium thailandense]MBV7275035.1 N-acetylmuramoyl-L-alanine amidase [Clostridium thailandense]MCH5136549.1 N-acetylmuramoyl-L-alanine amidase [Clostridiaceae bacterium UIB06]